MVRNLSGKPTYQALGFNLQIQGKGELGKTLVVPKDV